MVNRNLLLSRDEIDALLEGESFSSWFAHVAGANGLWSAELYRIVQPGGDRNPRDLDRYGDVHLLGAMAEKTGIPIEALEQSTFRRRAGRAFERDDGLVKLDWLPPARQERAKHCFGRQACPFVLGRRFHAPPAARMAPGRPPPCGRMKWVPVLVMALAVSGAPQPGQVQPPAAPLLTSASVQVSRRWRGRRRPGAAPAPARPAPPPRFRLCWLAFHNAHTATNGN